MCCRMYEMLGTVKLRWEPRPPCPHRFSLRCDSSLPSRSVIISWHTSSLGPILDLNWLLKITTSTFIQLRFDSPQLNETCPTAVQGVHQRKLE